MSEISPFRIEIPQSKIDRIIERVRAYQWPHAPVWQRGEDRWSMGTDQACLKELCDHWAQSYDWRKAEEHLNTYPQFRAQVDGYDIHFLHVKTAATNAETVLLTHGWPGSIWEFYGCIEPLTHPEKFRGQIEDGVNIVVPSLLGYGFSGKPERPVSPAFVARLWDKLMCDTLGYESYIAQGGDFGAMVSSFLGSHHSVAAGGGCKAVHLNMFAGIPGLPTETREENEWLAAYTARLEREGAYFYIQRSKPQTLSFAMLDSPVGQCAWIFEKFHGWTDRRGADGSDNVFNALSKDKILTNVMIYLVTDSFNTATWMYRGFIEYAQTMPAFKKIDVPSGMAIFPKEFISWPPRSYVERHYNVKRWTEFQRGGHFAALETGSEFAKDVLAFSQQIKSGAFA